MEEPLNDSKGCGGVMRMAPVGLVGPADPGERFNLGCELAALSHGHPSGYLAAGALAELIAELVGPLRPQGGHRMKLHVNARTWKGLNARFVEVSTIVVRINPVSFEPSKT